MRVAWSGVLLCTLVIAAALVSPACAARRRRKGVEPSTDFATGDEDQHLQAPESSTVKESPPSRNSPTPQGTQTLKGEPPSAPSPAANPTTTTTTTNSNAPPASIPLIFGQPLSQRALLVSSAVAITVILVAITTSLYNMLVRGPRSVLQVSAQLEETVAALYERHGFKGLQDLLETKLEEEEDASSEKDKAALRSPNTKDLLSLASSIESAVKRTSFPPAEKAKGEELTQTLNEQVAAIRRFACVQAVERGDKEALKTLEAAFTIQGAKVAELRDLCSLRLKELEANEKAAELLATQPEVSPLEEEEANPAVDQWLSKAEAFGIMHLPEVENLSKKRVILHGGKNSNTSGIRSVLQDVANNVVPSDTDSVSNLISIMNTAKELARRDWNGHERDLPKLAGDIALQIHNQKHEWRKLFVEEYINYEVRRQSEAKKHAEKEKDREAKRHIERMRIEEQRRIEEERKVDEAAKRCEDFFKAKASAESSFLRIVLLSTFQICGVLASCLLWSGSIGEMACTHQTMPTFSWYTPRGFSEQMSFIVTDTLCSLQNAFASVWGFVLGAFLLIIFLLVTGRAGQTAGSIVTFIVVGVIIKDRLLNVLPNAPVLAIPILIFIVIEMISSKTISDARNDIEKLQQKPAFCNETHLAWLIFGVDVRPFVMYRVFPVLFLITALESTSFMCTGSEILVYFEVL